MDDTSQRAGLGSAVRARAGIEAAAVKPRLAGYCVMCDRIVEIGPGGACSARPEHGAECITGRLALEAGESVPQLPGFNIAAFLMPPVWGPAHGQWAGAVFFPMWLFVDSIIASAVGGGGGALLGAAVVVMVTLSAQAWFAKRANGLAWRRVSSTTGVARYTRSQVPWAVASIPVLTFVVLWATYYRLVLA